MTFILVCIGWIIGNCLWGGFPLNNFQAMVIFAAIMQLIAVLI